jgi:DNA-binding transcriptional MerR regulator
LKSQAPLEKAPDAFRTISEVATDLDVPQHVLRFWESRFRDIKPMKRGGGRRYYRPEDIQLLRGIRHLLYGEGYTIRGVQRILREQGVKFVQVVWQPGAPKPGHGPADDDADVLAEEVDQGSTPVHEDIERGRGLLALLPSLLGDDEGDEAPIAAGARLQPLLPPATAERGRGASVPLPARKAIPQPPTTGLSREDVGKLQAVLHELSECKRLLGASSPGRGDCLVGAAASPSTGSGQRPAR